jgi:hypothetical protein
MFDNLMFIVAIIVILWLGGFTAYLYATRQQQDLSSQIDDLKKMFGTEGKDAKD